LSRGNAFITHYYIKSIPPNKDFYLIYAVNELSGDKGLYVIDKLEGTVQRFNNNLFITYQNQIDNYMLYLLISLAVLALTIITFSALLMKKNKHKHKFS